MISAVAQYILSVEHLDIMSRTLHSRQIHPICDESSGKPRCSTGNSVIVFEVESQGRKMAMRVYMRNHPNLRAIYGERYFEKELLVCASDTTHTLADVVLCDWHEGVSLQCKIEEWCCRPKKMAALSQMFERFALALLNEKWAHGDLKPENIIFSEDGLSLIDFDAMYREGFAVDDCVEIGTRQFQHPQRNKRSFGPEIDDYPIALITTALAAMAASDTIGREVPTMDYLLVQPHLAVEGKDEMLHRIEMLFAERGDARHYRIAKLLRSPRHELPQLKNLLEATPYNCSTSSQVPTLEYYGGYWGYAVDGRFVIPPLYDLAFEFSEGFALLRVDDVWHFINERGEVAISCGRGTGIKPFRNGVSQIEREDGTFAIYSDGRIEPL